MNEMLNSLYEALNKDIHFGFRSPEVEAGGQGAEQALRRPMGEDMRALTLPRYAERPIKRKSSAAFQLRYSAYGEASSVVCAHSYAWHDERRMPTQGAPNALSFAIEYGSSPVASATIVFESVKSGLACESLFPREIAALRGAHGRGLCELTSFSLNKRRRSRRAIAGLLHLMFLYARQARQMTGMVVLTRTQHVGIYEELLGFQRLAEKNGTVLIFIPFDYMRARIRQYGGHPDLNLNSAGLYRFFFQAKDEAGLLFRILDHLAASGTIEG